MTKPWAQLFPAFAARFEKALNINKTQHVAGQSFDQELQVRRASLGVPRAGFGGISAGAEVLAGWHRMADHLGALGGQLRGSSIEGLVGSRERGARAKLSTSLRGPMLHELESWGYRPGLRLRARALRVVRVGARPRVVGAACAQGGPREKICEAAGPRGV